jgi:hypothetical protein
MDKCCYTRFVSLVSAAVAGLFWVSCDSSGPEPAADEPACADAPRSPLRRLTRVEYDNSVRDLLGVTLAPGADFPPEEITGGFTNNATVQTVSPLLAEKYMQAAESLAAAAARNLPALLPCDPATTDEAACARKFVEQFGRRAYRRPLSAAEIDRLSRVYAAGREQASFEAGIELVIRAALQSPNFLYRVEYGMPARPGDKLVRLTQHEIAARLSYLIWSTMPDESLAAAADSGELETAEQIAARAERMFDDPRARKALPEFYRQWLGLGSLASVGKDSRVHPEFDSALREAMSAELPAFVEHVLWSADRRLGTLLTASLGFVSGPLANLYGVSAPAGSGPQLATLDPEERAGVLTQAGFLAVHSLPNQSSPVRRGKFVRERVLCQEAPAPPPNLNVTPPEVDASRSTRERFAEHTESAACSTCHELMDPIGFGFESYDAIGRFRRTDGTKPIDSSGWIVRSQDLDGAFANARGLAMKLAGSRQVHDCVATQSFRYAMGRFEDGADSCSLGELRQAFSESGGDLRKLMIAITQTKAFLYRPALEAEALP